MKKRQYYSPDVKTTGIQTTDVLTASDPSESDIYGSSDWANEGGIV